MLGNQNSTLVQCTNNSGGLEVPKHGFAKEYSEVVQSVRALGDQGTSSLHIREGRKVEAAAVGAARPMARSSIGSSEVSGARFVICWLLYSFYLWLIILLPLYTHTPL